MWCQGLDVFGRGEFLSLKKTKEIKGFKDPRMMFFLFELLDSNCLKKSSKIFES